MVCCHPRRMVVPILDYLGFIVLVRLVNAPSWMLFVNLVRWLISTLLTGPQPSGLTSYVDGGPTGYGWPKLPSAQLRPGITSHCALRPPSDGATGLQQNKPHINALSPHAPW